MPQLPVLDKRPADGGGGGGGGISESKTPFQLSQLDLGSIGVTKRPGGRKRAAASAALDDDEDPLEEAQVTLINVVTLGPRDGLRNFKSCCAVHALGLV